VISAGAREEPVWRWGSLVALALIGVQNYMERLLNPGKSPEEVDEDRPFWRSDHVILPAAVFAGSVATIYGARGVCWSLCASTSVETYFFILVLGHNCNMLFVWATILMALTGIVFLAVLNQQWNNDGVDVPEVFFGISLCVLAQMFAVYKNEWRERKSFWAERETRSKGLKALSLVESMLPKEVAQSMRKNQLQPAYKYTNMSLLFADIVEFTSYCSTVQPEQVVRMLTMLFSAFDNVTGALGLYKVYTIGDAYLVTNEPRKERPDPNAKAVLRMGIAMLDLIQQVRQRINHPNLDMRIGIHLGEFVAGVIGTKLLRFDMWGPDILNGNVCEQRGIAGAICVSEAFREQLPDRHEYRFTTHDEFRLAGDRSGRSMALYRIDPKVGSWAQPAGSKDDHPMAVHHINESTSEIPLPPGAPPTFVSSPV